MIIRRVFYFATLCVTGACVSPAFAQILTNTSDQAISLTIPFGNLTPGGTATPSTTQVQFRLRSSSNSGYKVQASAVFTATPSASVSGGSTISASDIGVGITSLSYASSVITPRTDTIASGFNYNPGSVTAVNGLTPFGGMLSGMATLGDIVNNSNLKILSGPKIATTETISSTNFITVTMKVGLLGQYFTPGTFSGTITLVIKNGQ